MKIKRLYVLHSITSINSQTSFDSSRHTIKYVKEVNCYWKDNPTPKSHHIVHR